MANFLETIGGVISPSEEHLWGQPPQPVIGMQQTWTPEQMQALQGVLGQFGQFGGAGYPGQLPGQGALPSLGQTSLAGLEQWALMMAQGGGGVPQAPGVGAQVTAPGAGPYQQSLQQMLQGGPGDFEEYYQKAVSEPMMRQYEEEILPGIRREMAPAYWGSERLGMEERSREDLMQQLTGKRAELAYGSWEAARNRALSAAGLGIGAEQQQFQTQVGQALGFGGLGMQQYGLQQQAAMMPGQAMLQGLTGADWQQQQTLLGQQSGYAEWLRQQGIPYQQANVILSALGLEPYEPYAMIQPGMPGGVQSAGGLFSGIGAL